MFTLRQTCRIPLTEKLNKIRKKGFRSLFLLRGCGPGYNAWKRVVSLQTTSYLTTIKFTIISLNNYLAAAHRNF